MSFASSSRTISAFAPNGRLWAGIALDSTFDLKKSPDHYGNTVVSMKADGSDLRVMARGLRQPFQLAFPYRSDTPLIYRAVSSWFVAVEKIKERLVGC